MLGLSLTTFTSIFEPTCKAIVCDQERRVTILNKLSTTLSGTMTAEAAKVAVEDAMEKWNREYGFCH